MWKERKLWSGGGKAGREAASLEWRGSGVGGDEEWLESVMVGKAEGGDGSGTGHALFIALLFAGMSCGGGLGPTPFGNRAWVLGGRALRQT